MQLKIVITRNIITKKAFQQFCDRWGYRLAPDSEKKIFPYRPKIIDKISTISIYIWGIILIGDFIYIGIDKLGLKIPDIVWIITEKFLIVFGFLFFIYCGFVYIFYRSHDRTFDQWKRYKQRKNKKIKSANLRG